jgi:hypothetical protein
MLLSIAPPCPHGWLYAVHCFGAAEYFTMFSCSGAKLRESVAHLVSPIHP